MARIRIKDHLEWAAEIARKVARKSHVVESTIDELIAVAHLQLVKQVRRFDPSLLPAGGDLVGLFRGFSFRTIRSECIGEVRRLRGGGLFSRRVRLPVVCESLSELALASLETQVADFDSVPAPIIVEPKPLGDIEAENRKLYLKSQLRALAGARRPLEVCQVYDRNRQLLVAGRIDARAWREILNLAADNVRAGVCIDPDCHQAKCQAHYAQALRVAMRWEEIRTAARERLVELKKETDKWTW